MASPIVRRRVFLRNLDWLKYVLILAGLTGCGGDDKKKENQPEPSPSTACQRICARSVEAGCANDPVDCLDACGAQAEAALPACEVELEAFRSCAEQATFTCDAGGASEPVGCAAQLSALRRCVDADAALEPDGGSDADERATGSVDAGLTTADASATLDASSIDAAAPTLPEPDAATICEARPSDSRCNVCLKSECCEAIAACDGDCLAVMSCIAACAASESCAQGCVSGLPPGTEAQVHRVAECGAGRCDVQCASGVSTTPPETPSVPTIALPEDCTPAGAVDADYCDLPGTPNGYACKARPFPDCVESPTGSPGIFCCSE